MHKILFTLSLVLILVSLNCFGQNKNKVKKFKIKSSITENTKVEDGKTIITLETEVFDNQGNVIEESKTINGALEEKETSKYNKDGKKTEHVVYFKDGTVKQKKTLKLNANNEITEKVLVDGNGAVIHKEITKYNNFDEKESEIKYDAKGNLIEKVLFTYDKNGLKKDRLTYDADNRLIGKKIYTYILR